MSERSVAESPAGAMGEEVSGRLGLPAIGGRRAVHRKCHCALGSGAKSGSRMVCWPALGGCAGWPCGLGIYRRGATGLILYHQKFPCLLAYLALWWGMHTLPSPGQGLVPYMFTPVRFSGSAAHSTCVWLADLAVMFSMRRKMPRNALQLYRCCNV